MTSARARDGAASHTVNAPAAAASLVGGKFSHTAASNSGVLREPYLLVVQAFGMLSGADPELQQRAGASGQGTRGRRQTASEYLIGFASARSTKIRREDTKGDEKQHFFTGTPKDAKDTRRGFEGAKRKNLIVQKFAGASRRTDAFASFARPSRPSRWGCFLFLFPW